MKHLQRHTPPGAKRVLRCFALFIAFLSARQALATLHLALFCVPPPIQPTTRGYLPAVGAPELRFQEPDLPSVRPSAKSSAAATPAKTNQAEASADAVVPVKTPSTAAEPPAHADLSPDENAPQKTKSAPSQRILPDDTHPVAHPEDFLPFFRFPSATGSSGSLDVIVPVPASAPSGPPLPPSSATYSQSPK